ncbi:capsular exopolysaccharide family [Cyclobacterium lianum]|uniref:Capsular exopolysaccharide family n=1 Tax=Cyclobacterium lianum TaxID=388280 RepID=A0A1M7NIF7_9BACT|nr:tyrosine-protein kinase family protein [Cyclobacterium lianum]SHN03025.1 capsular exopolysaccharide family [Cyclobacterium lianum]
MKMSDMLMDDFQPKEVENTDYKYLIMKYLKFWYLYVLGVAFCVGLAFFYFQYATPEYPIGATILINGNKGSDFSQNAVYSELETYQSVKQVENEAEVLKSVSLMQHAIQKLDLNVSYYVKDNYFRDKEIFGNQVPIEVNIARYDSAAFFDKDMLTKFKVHVLNEGTFQLENEEEKRSTHEFGEMLAFPFGEVAIERVQEMEYPSTVIINFNNPYALPGRYSGKLDVMIVNKLASVVRLSFTDPVPQKGVLVLNNLIEAYNKEAVLNKNQTARNTIDFINEQLDSVTTDLREIESLVEQYKKENKITELSSNAQQYASSFNQGKEQLAEYSIQLDVLTSIEDYLADQGGGYQAVPSSLNIEDQTLMNYISQFNELQRERERMLRTAQPGSPLIIEKDQQLGTIRRNILENIKNIKSSIEIARNNLLARTTEVEIQTGKVPEIERRLLEINRQQAIKQEHYQYLVKKREEAAMSLAATTVSNSRIIDPAMAGSKPTKPHKMLILGFAVFLGFGGPLGLVFAYYQLNTKIKVKKDVTSKTNISIIGEISHHDKKVPIAISKGVRTPVAEQFRLIRTNLQFALPNKDKKVVLVTSSTSGEGKTFFSLNLGVSMSLADKKVVILEFDLRKPLLLEYLGMSGEIGISDYLQNDSLTISDLIVKNDKLPQNLDIIGCGALPDDPSELMLLPKVGYFIDRLQEVYDVIIIDSAPVGQVADAFSLSKFSDITTYIMRYNYTTSEMIDFINENKKEKKLRNPVIVLNDAKAKLSYGYDYYQKGDIRKKKKTVYKKMAKKI